MVERVARAMWNQRRLGDGDECAAFDGSRFKATSWQDFEGLARLAIEAMREPTDAMMTNHHAGTRTLYNCMIDEALK